jgi:hypothetical protein
LIEDSSEGIDLFSNHSDLTKLVLTTESISLYKGDKDKQWTVDENNHFCLDNLCAQNFRYIIRINQVIKDVNTIYCSNVIDFR